MPTPDPELRSLMDDYAVASGGTPGFPPNYFGMERAYHEVRALLASGGGAAEMRERAALECERVGAEWRARAEALDARGKIAGATPYWSYAHAARRLATRIRALPEAAGATDKPAISPADCLSVERAAMGEVEIGSPVHDALLARDAEIAALRARAEEAERERDELRREREAHMTGTHLALEAQRSRDRNALEDLLRDRAIAAESRLRRVEGAAREVFNGPFIDMEAVARLRALITPPSPEPDHG